MKRTLFLCSLISIFFWQCSDNDPCFKETGDIIIETRTLDDNIYYVYIEDNLSLDIYIDTVNYIEVLGGENITPFVKTEVQNGMLSITNENSCKFLRDFDQGIRLALHIKEFDHLEYLSSKELIMHDTLKTQNFWFRSREGAGKAVILVEGNSGYFELGGLPEFHLGGNLTQAAYHIYGTCWVYADRLQLVKASVEHLGSGDCFIRTSALFDVELKSVGNIFYYGSPKVDVLEHTGTGILERAGN